MIKLSRVNLFLSLLGLIVGLFILGVSLLSANQVASYSGSRVICRKFYFSQEILPDHILYPFVAGLDRIILWIAPEREKIYLKSDYGQIRYRYAQGLLDKGKKDFALTTLTKSQKYHGLAAHAALSQTNAEELKQYVAQALARNIKKVEEISFEFTDDRRQITSEINQHNQLLLESLNKQLKPD